MLRAPTAPARALSQVRLSECSVTEIARLVIRYPINIVFNRLVRRQSPDDSSFSAIGMPLFETAAGDMRLGEPLDGAAVPAAKCFPFCRL
jgi:hypothetical protein